MKLEEIAHTIIDEFEDLLDKKDITIPSEDRENNPDEARIFGKEYYDLEERIAKILEKHTDEWYSGLTGDQRMEAAH